MQSQRYPLPNFPPCFFAANSNVILQSVHFKWSLSIRFSHQIAACISFSSLACRMCQPTHSPRFHSVTSHIAWYSWKSLLSSFLEPLVIFRLCGCDVIFRNSGHKNVKCFYMTINLLLQFRWLIVLTGSYWFFVSFKRGILVMYYCVWKMDLNGKGYVSLNLKAVSLADLNLQGFDACSPWRCDDQIIDNNLVAFHFQTKGK